MNLPLNDPATPLERIESPCVGTCTLDTDGLCIGCRRSAEEIGGWLAMSPDERREIMDVLPQRSRPGHE